MVRDETVKLQTVFREKYHFDTGGPGDVYQIPSKLSEAHLVNHISNASLEFSEPDTTKDKLMIVYYNGYEGIHDITRELLILG